MAVITKAEWRLARDEALANMRIEGHVPAPEFLAGFVGLLAGRTKKVATIEEINAVVAQGWAGMNTGEDGQ